MTRIEELVSKEELTEDDLEYIMTMDGVEYKEYCKAVSKDRGFINHIKNMNNRSIK
jgi:hypothetical protein